MGKRMTKAEQKALGGLGLIAVVLGAPVFAITKTAEAIGWPALIGAVMAGIVGYSLLKAWRRSREAAARNAALEARRSRLLQKYGDEDTVEKIMRGTIWLSQTAEQLRDSLGDPVDTDEKVMKTKRREVWKYHQISAKRFGLRVTVENGVVVGWDEKL
jgi:membrane protein implicated in regulation of membrane protease activity